MLAERELKLLEEDIADLSRARGGPAPAAEAARPFYPVTRRIEGGAAGSAGGGRPADQVTIKPRGRA